MKARGNNPSTVILDDVVPICPIFQVKPLTRAIWRTYGAPPLAIQATQQALIERREETMRINRMIRTGHK